MPQEPLDPELRTIEDALGRLAPARSRLDRDRLMFEAGARSARSAPQHRWVWPSIAAVLALVATSESMVLAVRPGARVIVIQAPAPRSSRSRRVPLSCFRKLNLQGARRRTFGCPAIARASG